MGSAAPETYRHLGLALKDEGEFSKAVEELNKALERGASDIRSWRGLAEPRKTWAIRRMQPKLTWVWLRRW